MFFRWGILTCCRPHRTNTSSTSLNCMPGSVCGTPDMEKTQLPIICSFLAGGTITPRAFSMPAVILYTLAQVTRVRKTLLSITNITCLHESFVSTPGVMYLSLHLTLDRADQCRQRASTYNTACGPLRTCRASASSVLQVQSRDPIWLHQSPSRHASLASGSCVA